MHLQLGKPLGNRGGSACALCSLWVFQGEELSILLLLERSRYRDLEFKGLFGWDFCFHSELLRGMNHSSISLAEHTWVLLKHMNAGEHRDWHVFLVSRASQIPCVPAGRLPQLPVTAALQQRDWYPEGCSGLGLQAGGCVCMGAAAGALGVKEHFCDVEEAGELGWGELLVLAKVLDGHSALTLKSGFAADV